VGRGFDFHPIPPVGLCNRRGRKLEFSRQDHRGLRPLLRPAHHRRHCRPVRLSRRGRSPRRSYGIWCRPLSDLGPGTRPASDRRRAVVAEAGGAIDQQSPAAVRPQVRPCPQSWCAVATHHPKQAECRDHPSSNRRSKRTRDARIPPEGPFAAEIAARRRCQDCHVAISARAIGLRSGRDGHNNGGQEPNSAAILEARRSCQRFVEALASMGPEAIGRAFGDQSPSVAKRSSLWPKA
jgi:hypothetical protein